MCDHRSAECDNPWGGWHVFHPRPPNPWSLRCRTRSPATPSSTPPRSRPAPTRSPSPPLILGILGFLSCGVTSVIAVILGHVALGQIRRDRTAGNGMALTGVILGWLLTTL